MSRASPAVPFSNPRASRFIRDDALHMEVAPHLSRAKFAASLAVLEREEGFPKVDPLFGGRYLPAVNAYLDARSGLGKHKTIQAPDGEETW